MYCLPMSLTHHKDLRGIGDYLEGFFSDCPDVVAVLGSGKSVRLAHGLSRDIYKIAVGDLPIRAPNLGPFDLWVTANTEFPQPLNYRHQRLIAKSNCSTIAMSTICTNDNVSLHSLASKQDYSSDFFTVWASPKSVFYFDQRHFKEQLCSPNSNCCILFQKLLKPTTIQEFIVAHFGLPGKAYSQGQTVSLHALAMAILLKPKEIFIFGIELPERQSDYSYYKSFAKIDRKLFENMVFHYRRLRYGRNRQGDSPFGGNERSILLSDFQLLIDLALSNQIAINVIGKDSALQSLNGVRSFNRWTK